MVGRRSSGYREGARLFRMLGRDVLAFGALIGWYVLLLALGLVLGPALFPEIPGIE